MNILLLRWSALAFVVGTLMVLSAGCVLPVGGGYGYDDVGSIGVGYYEPYGGDYGGWGPGYHVAPFRGGGNRPPGGGHVSAPAFRSAPASRSMPSLPSHGGGGHSGGSGGRSGGSGGPGGGGGRR